MGYIIKLVSKESEKEQKKITDIARKIFKKIEEVKILEYIDELEKNGYLFCRKIKLE